MFHIHRGTLEFVDHDVLPPVITHGPVRLDDSPRATALEAERAQVSAVLRA